MADVELNKINLITKRDLERKLDAQKRKDNRNNLCADSEKIDYFEQTFTTKRDNVQKLITESGNINKDVLADHFNNISREILLLQKYVAASNIFLRSYDIKKCQESLLELGNKAKELESDLLPKKKFGFKNKSKHKVPAKIDNDKDEVDFSHKNTFPAQNLPSFCNQVGKDLALNGEDIFRKDIAIEHLEDCTVHLCGTPSTLHLNNLKNCRVLTGPVSTSIFAECCENSTLVIACQQLRLHGSNNVKIYLHVTSRAIMEDCRNILITPYNLHYDRIEDDFKKSGLDISVNNWKSIDDFNWLNTGRKSPNWDVLDEKLVEKWNILT